MIKAHTTHLLILKSCIFCFSLPYFFIATDDDQSGAYLTICKKYTCVAALLSYLESSKVALRMNLIHFFSWHFFA